MATEGISSGSSYLRVGSVFGSTKELRSAVARAYLATGHGFRASGKGGGRQKKYSCSGAAEPPKPKQDPSQVPVAPPVVSSACTSEVRATKSVLGEWRVTHADFEHANCSGGNARARLCGIDPLVKATLNANPDIGVKALRKTIQQETGVPVSVSTATRARSNVLHTDATEVANSYHDLPGYFQALRRVAGFNCGRRGEKFEMEYGSHERSTWRGSCSFPFIVRARGIAGSHVRMAALG